MTEPQPPTIIEGATTGDVEDEIPKSASAEDRKAEKALSSLDAPRDDESTSTKDVDRDAVRKAMDRLIGVGAAMRNDKLAKKADEKKVVKKSIKVDAADVNLLVEELELTKIKATDLLKSHDGEVSKALKAYITPITA